MKIVLRGLLLIAAALVVATCVGAWQAIHPSALELRQLNAQTGYPFAQLTACYQQAMQLEAWTIEIQVYSDSADIRAAHNKWDLVRRSAVISYNVSHAEPASAREIVVHELSHVLTAELYWLAASASPPAAQLASERLAHAMGAWPLWVSLCRDRKP